MKPQEITNPDVDEFPTEDEVSTEKPNTDTELDTIEDSNNTDQEDAEPEDSEQENAEENKNYIDLSPEQIKRLKTLSVIVSIIAGIGSTAYYAYSMVVGDTMILRPADTIIIQDGDLKLDEGSGTKEATEQSVVERLIESKKTEKNFIPVDYYVGKILDVSIPNIETEVKSIFPTDPRKAGLIIKVQKTYDITNKKRLKDEIDCQMDSINVRHFQKWRELEANELDMAGIKLRKDDLIGFRHSKQGNQSICEIFQVNNINLIDYTNNLGLFYSNESGSSGKLISGKIESFTDSSNLALKKNHPGTMGHIFEFRDDQLYSVDSFDRLGKQLVMSLTIYLHNNPDVPLGNVTCKITNDQASELLKFYNDSMLDFNKAKGRIFIELVGSGETEEITVPRTNPGKFGGSLRMPSIFYSNCRLENIKVLDMGKRNVIDTHNFR